MARFKDIDGVQTSNLFKVHPSLLVVDPTFNIRLLDEDYEDRVERYSKMFQENSRCPALTVWLRGEEIVVIDGHLRRLGALRAIERGAEVKSVDVIQHLGNDADRIAAMLSSEGRIWSPIERQSGYKTLRSYGWSDAEIAKRFGRSEGHVRDILILADSDSAVQQMVRDGRVSATTAIDVVKVDGHRAIETLTAAAVTAEKAGKAKVTNKHVNEARADSVPATKKTPRTPPAPEAEKKLTLALRDLATEVRDQAEAQGLTDIDFEDHNFTISGRFLRTILMSQL